MNISVCIGSACHLKGSYTIINQFKDAVVQHGLEEKVVVRAAFCLGQCSNEGVSVKLGEELIIGVTSENFDQVFTEHVLNVLK